MVPTELKEAVESITDRSIVDFHRASGGSINQAAIVAFDDESRAFLKWNRNAPEDMFAKEQKGLERLRSAESGLVIPRAIDTGTDASGNTHFILIDYLNEGRPGATSASDFGEGLAQLHKSTNDRYGLDHDNYIGRLPQSNTFHTNWIDFLREERYEPQLKRARKSGKLSAEIATGFESLYKKLPDLLADEPPSLLHGDLWGGNYFYTAEGDPAIYDPAVYYGNREIEIAFTHLFGGFSYDFYDAYTSVSPLQPGFDERKDIYNLYPLLVHVNLFGGGYVRQVTSIINRFT